ncbi:hypothetical protein MVG78_04820 [Roseomonas gilardii subsp. gilardii]|uniref:hypothetical protein n=1 Tax=Roseomonas gilardii TaxID=257708 RepID=UPI001FFBFED1|nr:hypothetical protein [Roseomonas gilardii]UPG73481.1 hypothetical protein MVG78_04820 [Roseomonas gilardii subsp. gilardii]
MKTPVAKAGEGEGAHQAPRHEAAGTAKHSHPGKASLSSSRSAGHTAERTREAGQAAHSQTGTGPGAEAPATRVN